MVKEWDPTTWALSNPYEIFLPKTATLEELSQLISSYFPYITKENMYCTKINSPWNFHRVQLPYETWYSLNGNSNFIASAPFYVSTDGLLFIIKDISKTERELTEEEKEAYNCD